MARGHPTLPDDVRRVLELRVAGHSVASITEHTGLSASTVFRHCKRHAVHRGSLSEEAINQARQHLLDDSDFVSSLKTQIAASILDDLHMSQRIKASALLALEQVEEDDTISPVLKARSLASIATAVKVSSDVQRRCLRLDDPSTLLQSDDLPVLTVAKMTDSEIHAAQHRFDEDELDDVEVEVGESVTGDLSLTEY